MYALLRSLGIRFLEIAPTRIFDRPYSKPSGAAHFATQLKTNYDIQVVSMQSIWFGMTENIFGTPEERSKLLDYTKEAIYFADAIGCQNLVFGCPRNRQMPDPACYAVAVDFFGELGNFLSNRPEVIAIEPNPAIYGTNFINNTQQAFEFCRQVGSKNIRVNVDLGTMIVNNEDLSDIIDGIDLVSHVHLSEPHLAKIEKRRLHRDLRALLMEINYCNCISVEMKQVGDIQDVQDTLAYICEVFT